MAYSREAFTDEWGDVLTIETGGRRLPSVWIVAEGEGNTNGMQFKPDEARKIAAAILEAAEAAEAVEVVR